MKKSKVCVAALAAGLLGTAFALEPDSHPLVGCPQYWTPAGEDTWVGDVVVGTFKGRFHVFAYGFHTERVENWKELGLPAGATWAESEDK